MEHEGLDSTALLEGVEIHHNDPMVRDAARGILERAMRYVDPQSLENAILVSTDLAEAVVERLEQKGWF